MTQTFTTVLAATKGSLPRLRRPLFTLLSLGLAVLAGCAAPEEEMALDGGIDPSGSHPEDSGEEAGDDGSADLVAPTVEILSPDPDAVVGGVVEIEVAAEDDIEVTQVVVRVDGSEVGTLREPPYRVSWDAKSFPVAHAEISAVARDAAGNEGEASRFVHNFGSGGAGGSYPGDIDNSIVVNAKSRDYFLYIPSTYDPSTPAPLLTVHHGAGGPSYKGRYYRDYWTQIAEANGFILLSQDSLDDQNGGWLIEDADFWVEEVTATMTEYNIDRNQIYVWGYSAGGHFAHYLGMKYSPFITAYAVHSGTLGPFHVLSLPAVLERKIPVGIWVGNKDPNAPSCKNTRDTFIDAGWVLGERLEFTEFPGGHEAPQSQLPTVWSFLTQWRFVD